LAPAWAEQLEVSARQAREPFLEEQAAISIAGRDATGERSEPGRTDFDLRFLIFDLMIRASQI
jgi:hypothetical protein